MRDDDTQKTTPSRRSVLKAATATAGGLAVAGQVSAHHRGDDADGPLETERDDDQDDPYQDKGVTCGYTNPVFGKGFVFPDHHDVCAGDHPETVRIKDAVRYSLDQLYPDVPTLIAHGFIPYFDILSVGGFSHWLHPEHIKADHMVDPGRPETVLVNNDSYCAQGMMFIPDHEVAGREPPVYVDGDPGASNHEFIYPKRETHYEEQAKNDDTDKTPIELATQEGEASYFNSEQQGYYDEYERKLPPADVLNDGTVCAPWHRHTDGAARFAWWYHRQVNSGAALENDEVLFWCVVPAMFHVWPGTKSGSIHVYEHGAPSEARRDETLCYGSYGDGEYASADGSELTLADLPPAVRERAMPAGLERELEILGDFEDGELFRMTVGEVKSLVT